MATTPARTRSSGIPTPGRLRSFSSSASSHPPLPVDSDVPDRAFAEAIKANDPTRYPSRSVSASSSSQRPPSVTSGSRPKTPGASQHRSIQRRPESRQSDFLSRTHREFIVGDNVRVESLGFEGTLRYVGEISGKPGEWAGVELSGGFAGLGKNDGSVGNIQYFSCPEKCGVFIAYSKLSPPTVGPGSYSRPSSVASSRASLSGRITPSFTGRRTPSGHSGRVTPLLPNGIVASAQSSGRITPSSSFGISTPAGRASQKSTSIPPPPSSTNTPSVSAMSKITAGSRASKYVGMTAQQLSARKSPSFTAPTSPSRQNIGLGSPTRLLGPPSPSRSETASPSRATTKPSARFTSLGTPKSFGSGRPSLTTPKAARIPSAIAMPPPSPPIGGSARSISLNDKPSTPTFSIASNDTAVDDDAIESLSSIQQSSRALKDKIQSLLSGKSAPSYRSHSPSASQTDALKDCFDDDVSGLDVTLRSMQEHLDSLERENAQLKVALEDNRQNVNKLTELDALRVERVQNLSRIQELEAQLKTAERSLNDRISKIESLDRTNEASSRALESVRAEGDARGKDLQAKIDDCETLISSLKDAIEAKSNEAGQNEGVIQAKNAEIGLLEARVRKANSDLEDVRHDLAGQIDELRHAGQETIALYEERLGVAESKRYELEDLAEQLEEQLKKRSSPLRRASGEDQDLTEATRIDNEMLRDQVVHLQRKISGLEDLLEETRGNAEREEATVRTRLQRYKDNDASMRGEVAEVRKEIERLSKSESLARGKTEEAEEALRENTLALENARAEIEGLRGEVASLESIQARNSTEKARTEESSRRAALERSRHDEEVAQLRELLDAARVARKEALQELDAAKSAATDTSGSMSGLKDLIETLDSDKAELEHARAELTTKLERERAVVAELRQMLDEKALELESSRKTLNRDRPLNVSPQDMTPTSTLSKVEPNTAREEIKGLKHIVQELQKENSTISNRIKMLESENKMLLKETDSLREELRLLEDNVEQSLLHEEHALASEGEQLLEDGASPDVQKKLLDLKAKHDIEIEQLRKKMAELEKKSTRTIHDLNKEVNELESLVEAKIYREDELESEVERLKQKVSKGRPSKSSTELSVPDQHSHHSSSNSTSTINGSEHISATPANAMSTSRDPMPSESEVCEICERPGHDIFTCDLLKDGSEPTISPASTSVPKNPKGTDSDLFCEDCESHGHLAANCPHSLDVF
ncbi:hypothetical protein DFH11DRAFT_1561792 [Phellopilus nigrolimitatus]|nr:hypothetical protein DFH11DRAFT_1561792 [Phellopilus nigrolimitatus]